MRSFVLFGFYLIFLTCKADGIPENIPEGSKYDKRTNIFQYKADGKIFKYFKNGKLYEECETNDVGQLHGLCKTYLKSTGQKIAWGRFERGQRDGEWIWTFEDGSIFLKQEFTYGKKRDFWIPVEEWGNEDGNYSRYYASGDLEESGYYDSGYKTGSWKKYYLDGKLEHAGSYLKGKRVGSWIHYYPSGNIEAKEKYDSQGNLIRRTTYYPNGEVWCNVDANSKQDCKAP